MFSLFNRFKFYRSTNVQAQIRPQAVTIRPICFQQTQPRFGAEPGFGGDDGEPELQYEAFSFAFFRDRARFRKKKVKRVKLQDPYSYSLLTAPAERSRQQISRMWHRDIASFDNVLDRARFFEQYMGRTSDIDQPTLDDTESFKALTPGSIPPAGHEIPVRAQGVVKFLANYPTGRISLNRGSPTEPFSGRMPQSFGSRYNRYAFGHRQPNSHYGIIKWFSGSEEHYLNPASFPKLKTRTPWYRSERPVIFAQPHHRTRKIAPRAFNRRVSHIKHNGYLMDRLPTSGIGFGQEIREGFGIKKQHMLPILPHEDTLNRPSTGLEEVQLLGGVTATKPLNPNYLQLYADVDTSVPDEDIEDEDLYYEDNEDEEEDYFKAVARHDNDNPHLSHIAIQTHGGWRLETPEEFEIGEMFEGLARARYEEFLNPTPKRVQPSDLGLSPVEDSSGESHIESLRRWSKQQSEALTARRAGLKTSPESVNPDALVKLLNQVPTKVREDLNQVDGVDANGDTSIVSSQVHCVGVPEPELLLSGESFHESEDLLCPTNPLPGSLPDVNSILVGTNLSDISSEGCALAEKVGEVECTIVKKDPVAEPSVLPVLDSTSKQVRPFSTMYPETPWLTDSEKFVLFMFENLTTSQLALYSFIYPSLVGRYLELGFPFHGGPKLPETRTFDYDVLAIKMQEIEQQRAARTATRAAYEASVAARYGRLGLYDFARITLDNAYFQYDYAFRNLRWAPRVVNPNDLRARPASIIKGLGWDGSRSGLPAPLLGRGVSSKIQNFSFDFMDGLLSADKTPYLNGGWGGFFKVKPESRLAFRREDTDFFTPRKVEPQNQYPTTFPPYAQIKEAVDARLQRLQEVDRAIGHLLEVPNYRSTPLIPTAPVRLLPPKAKPTVCAETQQSAISNTPVDPTFAPNAFVNWYTFNNSNTYTVGNKRASRGNLLNASASYQEPFTAKCESTGTARTGYTMGASAAPFSSQMVDLSVNQSTSPVLVSPADTPVPPSGNTPPTTDSGEVLSSSEEEVFYPAEQGPTKEPGLTDIPATRVAPEVDIPVSPSGGALPVPDSGEIPSSSEEEVFYPAEQGPTSGSISVLGPQVGLQQSRGFYTPFGNMQFPAAHARELPFRKQQNSLPQVDVSLVTRDQPQQPGTAVLVDFMERPVTVLGPRPLSAGNFHSTSTELPTLTQVDNLLQSPDLPDLPPPNAEGIGQPLTKLSTDLDESVEKGKRSARIIDRNLISAPLPAGALQETAIEKLLPRYPNWDYGMPYLPMPPTAVRPTKSRAPATHHLSVSPAYRSDGQSARIETESQQIWDTSVVAPAPHRSLAAQFLDFLGLGGTRDPLLDSPVTNTMGGASSPQLGSVQTQSSPNQLGLSISRPGVPSPDTARGWTFRRFGENASSQQDRFSPTPPRLSNKSHDFSVTNTEETIAFKPMAGQGSAYALNDPDGWIDVAVSAVRDAVSQFPIESLRESFVGTPSQYISQLADFSFPTFTEILQTSEAFFSQTSVKPSMGSDVTNPISVPGSVEPLIAQQVDRLLEQKILVMDSWSQLFGSDSAKLTVTFPGVCGHSITSSNPRGGLAESDVQTYSMAMSVLSEAGVLDALSRATAYQTLPDLSQLFNKTLRLALRLHQNIGISELPDSVWGRVRDSMRQQLHKLVLDRMLSNPHANALCGSEHLAAETVMAVLTDLDPEQFFRRVVLQDLWGTLKGQIHTAGTYISDSYQTIPNAFVMSAMETLTSTERGVGAPQLLEAVKGVSVSEAISKLLNSTAPTSIVSSLGHDSRSYLHCQAVLLDFFLIGLFQKSEAAQMFVNRNLSSLANWLATPPVEVIRAVERSGISDLAFSKAFGQALPGDASSFQKYLSQFSARDVDGLDYSRFYTQIQDTLSLINNTNLSPDTAFAALTKLCLCSGLSHPSPNLVPFHLIDKFAIPAREASHFGASIHAPVSATERAGTFNQLVNFLSPVGDLILAPSSEIGVGELAVVGYDYAVSQVVGMVSESKPVRQFDWALSSEGEQLAIEKTQFNLAQAGVRTINPGFRDNVFFPVTKTTGLRLTPPSTANLPLQTLAADIKETNFVTNEVSTSKINTVIYPAVADGGRTEQALRILPIASNSSVTFTDYTSFGASTKTSGAFSHASRQNIDKLVYGLVQRLRDRSTLRVADQQVQLIASMDTLVSSPTALQPSGLLENLYTNTIQFALSPAEIEHLQTQMHQLQTHQEVFTLVRRFLEDFQNLRDLPHLPLHEETLKKFPILGLGLLPERVVLPALLLELPPRLQFNFAQPGSAHQILKNWHATETTLVEKCQTSIMRLLLHYTSIADQSVQGGRPWYNAVLEFIRAHSALQAQLDTLGQLTVASDEGGLAAFASKLLMSELQLLSAPTEAQLVLRPTSANNWEWCVLRTDAPVSMALAPDLDLLRCATRLDSSLEVLDPQSSFSSVALTLIGRQVPPESFGSPIYCNSSTSLNSRTLEKLASILHTEGSRIVFTQELVSGLKPLTGLSQLSSTLPTPTPFYRQVMELVVLSTLNPGPERYDQLLIQLGLLFSTPTNIQIPTLGAIRHNWQNTELREGLAFQIISGVLHSLQVQGLCNLPEIGHLARQALISLSFGDKTTVAEVSEFWYDLACNPAVTLFKGPSSSDTSLSAGLDQTDKFLGGGLEALETSDHAAVLELFRLATDELGCAFSHDRTPVGGIGAWVYQWVWEFYYQTDGGVQIRQAGLRTISPASREAFCRFIQQKITVFKGRTESNVPFRSELYSAVTEAKRMGAGFFDARTLTQRLEQAESKESSGIVMLLKYLIPEPSVAARFEPASDGIVLGQIRKFPGYGHHLYDTDTMASALTSHCHVTPGPELFPRRFTSSVSDRITLSHCFQRARPVESYTYEDFIPRAVGRDAIQPHYDVIISNPIARKWFTARRRMDKITLTHEVQTTTPWRFTAWFERRKLEHRSEMLYLSESFWNYALRSDFGCVLADVCEILSSPHFTAFNILKVYLNYWVIRVFVPLWYIQRRVWEHRDNAPNFEFRGPTERPLGKVELLESDVDVATVNALHQNSGLHDLLYFFSAAAILVLAYYWYMSYRAAKDLHDSVFNLSIYHMPLRYLERADWYEVREDRDNSYLVKKYFPDFEYMTKADEDTIHLANVTKYVDYDNIWLSMVDKPENDIYFGPRYIDEETLGETIEIIGYESPDWTGTRSTDIKEVNFWDIGVIDGHIESSFVDKFKRKSNYWIWDQEVTPLANQPGIEYEDFVDIMYFNYHRVFYGQLKGFVRGIVWLVLSTSWFWAATLCVLIAEACMRSDLSFWSMPMSINTVCSPQFWFEWFVTRGLPMVTPSVARNRLFHFLEYLEYNFPTNVHRPDWFTNLYLHNEKADVEDAYALNFGLDFSDLTPEDATRIMRASDIAPVYSPHRFFVGRDRAATRLMNENIEDFYSRITKPAVDSYIRSLGLGVDIFEWAGADTDKMSAPWAPLGEGLTALEDTMLPGNFFFNQLSDWVPQFYQPRRPWARNFKTNKDWFWRNVYNAPPIDPLLGVAKPRFANFSHKADASTFDPQEAMKFFDPLRSRRYLFDWSPDYSVPTGVILNTNFSTQQGFDLPRGVRQERYQTRRVAMPKRNIKKVMDFIFKGVGGRPYAPLEHNDLRPADRSELDQSWDSTFLQKYGRYTPHASEFIQYQPIPAFGEYSPTSYTFALTPVAQVYTSEDWWVQPGAATIKVKHTNSPWLALWKNYLVGGDHVAIYKLLGENENCAEWQTNWNLHRLRHMSPFRRDARGRLSGLFGNVRRTDADLDSLTDYTAISGDLSLQASGGEATKPHFHWLYDTAAQLYDLDMPKHTSKLPIADSRLQSTLWALRRWAGPFNNPYHADTTAELFKTNESILENQGSLDSWADTTVQDSRSKRLRDQFRHALSINAESNDIPNRAYAYFVPLVNPFFRTWRSKAARWVVSLIPEHWFGRGTTEIIARYVGRDALPYDLRPWGSEPMAFVDLASPTFDGLVADKHNTATIADFDRQSAIDLNSLSPNRIKFPSVWPMVDSNYQLFSRDWKWRATDILAKIPPFGDVQHPLQQISGRWSFGLARGSNPEFLSDSALVTHTREQDGLFTSEELCSKFSVARGEDLYVAEAERLLSNASRNLTGYTYSDGLTVGLLDKMADSASGQFHFTSTYLKDLTDSLFSFRSDGTAENLDTDLQALNAAPQSRCSAALTHFGKLASSYPVDSLLVETENQQPHTPTSYTANTFVFAQLWASLVSGVEFFVAIVIATGRLAQRMVSYTARGLGFTTVNVRHLHATDRLAEVTYKDRHESLRVWFESLRQFRVVADLKKYSALASAEAPSLSVFTDSAHAIPLTNLLTSIRELKYRRTTQSIALQRVFDGNSNHVVTAPRWRRLSMALTQLFWETLEACAGFSHALEQAKPTKRLLAAQYFLGRLGWGIGPLEVVLWPLKVLGLAGIRLAQLGVTGVQIITFCVKMLGRTSWLLFSLVRQSVIGLFCTTFSSTTSILSYLLSSLQLAAQSVIWVFTRTYLTILDTWLALGHLAQFVSDSVVVAFYQAIFGIMHAVANRTRKVLLRATHAVQLVADQVRTIELPGTPRRRMKFVGPYVYRKHSFDLGKSARRFVNFTFRTAAEIYLAICDGWEYLMFQLDIYKRSCKLQASVKYWRLRHILTAYGHWFRRWFSPHSIFGTNHRSNLFSDSMYWSRGGWSDAFYKNVGFSQSENIRRDWATGLKPGRSYQFWTSRGRGAWSVRGHAVLTPVDTYWSKAKAALS